MKQWIYIILGSVAVILGLLGVCIPGLPTTPFILLASWLFYNSSRCLHDSLHRSFLGKYIRRYESRNGVSVLSKVISLLSMWCMILISAFLFFESTHMRILLIVLGLIGSFCILYIVPTASSKN